MIQLLNNEGISFIAAKNFTYGGTEYVMGQEFPQEEARNIETLVRARFVLPVLEEGALRPRHWHGHVRTREEAEEYLNRDRIQLVWPTEPDTAVDLETLTYPERTPEPEGPGQDVFDRADDSESAAEGDQSSPEPEAAPEPPESLEETYDPAEHNVEAVLQYMDEHPEQREEVLAMERAGRGRKGILGEDE